MEALNQMFQKIESVNYQHREGGRYAYVQMMAYLRDLRNLLVEQRIALTEVSLLLRSEALLNEMVHLRFDLPHQIIFEDTLREVSAMKVRIAIQINELEDRSLDKVA